MSDSDTEAAPSLDTPELRYHGWTRVYRTTVRWPDGKTSGRDIEDHGEGVAVLAFDPERRTALLVKQFRPPPAFVGEPPFLLEPIAGILESGSPEECARREAMEEAGVQLGGLEPVGTTWMMPGISTERIHFYLAAYTAADRIAAGGGLAHEGEHIVVEELPLDDLARHLARPTPVDSKLLILYQALRLRRPELFSEEF